MTALWQSRPVGIVGLGLIGGSIGLDLRQAGAEVRGLVRRPATAERAIERGLCSVAGPDPALLKGCGLVVLALPLDRLLDPDPSLSCQLPAGAVITDVGSVKGPVLRCWETFPGFVGSHPMAGTAQAGVEAGVPGLFAGRPWVATPTERTDPEALEEVHQLALALGARWLCSDADSHDRAVALISHLPVLVSAALLEAADRGAAASGDAALPSLVRALASSGFADTTRVGAGNPDLGVLMARYNREALRDGLARYRDAFTALEQLVALEDWSGLSVVLGRCQQLRPPFL